MEAATSDLHAGLSLRLAGEKRTLIEQLNKDADEIEANIKAMDEKLATGYWECENGHEMDEPARYEPTQNIPESAKSMGVSYCKCGSTMRFIQRDQMTGQQKTQSDRERNEAQTIAANKRATAKAEEENAVGSEKAAQYFKGQAANNRQVADKIRAL
ncbi:MAG TPA: hypothetical protein VK578_10415 [Edaphobacter sp.]|nr:hypothetical protein [Edaphobacter sp.]